MRAVLALAPLVLLAACGEAGTIAPPASVADAPPPRAPHRGIADPVTGADAETLVRLFGPPRLDIREGAARKLQWSGSACVLDAYLYPDAAGGRARTAYAEARDPDGHDLSRSACIAALRRN